MNMFRSLLLTILFGHFSLTTAESATIPLAGDWRFELDADDKGVREEWFGRKLTDSIPLPGTTDEARKGEKSDEAPTDRLARPWRWKAPAWYQREVEIPQSWKGKRVTLFLERTKNSRVWVNDTFCGRENTLSAPHIFDLTKAIKPGKQTITIRIDNSKLPPVGPSHQVDERTQTNWNGIVGAMELRATDPVWIEDLQVFPDATTRSAKVRVKIGNTTGKPATGKLIISCKANSATGSILFPLRQVRAEVDEDGDIVEFTYRPGNQVRLWSEFDPSLLSLGVELRMETDGSRYSDKSTVRFGMRDFSTEGNLLQCNGNTVFLRGRLDCANYPLTGYAPMDKSEWLRIFGVLREWGLNHVRFHSWCPPRAAFEAADETGFYLQVELPNKRSAFKAEDSKEAAHHNIDFLEGENMDETMSLYDFGKREAELIFRHFGNHPSFVMFTLGNELGRNEGMFDLVRHFKEIDPRHLYAQGSNNMHWKPGLAEGDDFWVTGKVGDDVLPIRGSFYLHDYRHGSIDHSPPGTMDDFSESINGVPVPLIGHETGQYQVYPDFWEIPKYTGVLQPEHLKIFRERLKEAGMLDQADDFVKASGALAAICYREDMELALRTPGLGGFQLLDIMDFPGQGTALVGMLNVFMESKGVIEPEVWRQSCAPVVPLARMEKLTWKGDETLDAKVEIAHYGPSDFTDQKVRCSLRTSDGKPVMEQVLPAAKIERGGLQSIGTCTFDLGEIKEELPRKFHLTVSIGGNGSENRYSLWIYPPKVDTSPPEGVVVSRSLGDAKTAEHLESGGKVLLLPPLDKLPHSIPGMFQTEFWSPMFAKSAKKRGIEEPPGTLGHLCDPEHPAFAAFPTEFHSNWQWWRLVKHSRPIILDETPHNYRPIVQSIDNFDRNHKLGLLFETKVGKGSVLICAIDLLALEHEPEARQLLHSLLQYLGSDDFAPKDRLDPAVLEKLLGE